MLMGHQLHAVFNTIIRCYRKWVCRHQLVDGCLVGRYPLKNKFTGIVTLSKYSGQLSVVNNQHPPDVLLAHHLNCLKDRGTRFNEENRVPLFL